MVKGLDAVTLRLLLLMTLCPVGKEGGTVCVGGCPRSEPRVTRGRRLSGFVTRDGGGATLAEGIDHMGSGGMQTVTRLFIVPWDSNYKPGKSYKMNHFSFLRVILLVNYLMANCV